MNNLQKVNKCNNIPLLPTLGLDYVWYWTVYTLIFWKDKSIFITQIFVSNALTVRTDFSVMHTHLSRLDVCLSSWRN
jgi:hypothetical protein